MGQTGTGMGDTAGGTMGTTAGTGTQTQGMMSQSAVAGAEPMPLASSGFAGPTNTTSTAGTTGMTSSGEGSMMQPSQSMNQPMMGQVRPQSCSFE